MEAYNNEIIENDIKESFLFLLHKLWLIGIIGILFAVCTGLVHVYLLAPAYTSTAKIYMSDQLRSSSEKILLNSETSTQLAKDSAKLIKDREVMKEVIVELKLRESPDQLAQKVTVDMAQDSWCLTINFVYQNPTMAKKIVDTIARISLEKLEDEGNLIESTRLEEGNLPTVPCNPNLSKKVFLGAVSGILFSIAFLALGHRPGGSNQNSEEMEQYLGCSDLQVFSLRRKLIGDKKRGA